MQVRDVLLALFGLAEGAGRRRQIAARRRRADARRPGSLTYNRQQAARDWESRRRNEL